MGKLFGKFRAEVVDIDDPEKKGRIRVKCPAVFGEDESDWGLPCFHPGVFNIPKVGEIVWIEFEGGNPRNMLWVGYLPKGRFLDTTEALYQNKYPQLEPERYGIEFKEGSFIEVKEDVHDDEVYILIETNKGEKIQLGDEGYIEISDGEDASIIFEEGHITIKGTSITLEEG